MERYTLTQRFTEARMLALTEQRTILLAEAAEDKAAALAEQRTVLEAAAAEDKAAALKELKLLLESVAAEDKARALAALKAQLEAAAAKAQAEALAALKAQLEAEFERQLAALRVRTAARKLRPCAALMRRSAPRRPCWRRRSRRRWHACALSWRQPPPRTRPPRWPRWRLRCGCVRASAGAGMRELNRPAAPLHRRLSSSSARSPSWRRMRSSCRSCATRWLA